MLIRNQEKSLKWLNVNEVWIRLYVELDITLKIFKRLVKDSNCANLEENSHVLLTCFALLYDLTRNEQTNLTNSYTKNHIYVSVFREVSLYRVK